ncbi:hypothetical protein V501_01393 [Pseudogymnoascus sp. VKM F-4519 (FW-2642)]|nr:hypothetical protein V501_01393 [Pseudogymnoascus sp. VKM F-4519 (FW-2642)]
MKISSIIPLFAALAAVKAQIAPGPYTIRSLASDERGVETAHKARGWVAPDALNPDRQLALKPLIAGASIPPFYPPFEGAHGPH